MNITWLIIGLTFLLQGLSYFTPISATLLGIAWVVSGLLVIVNTFYPLEYGRRP